MARCATVNEHLAGSGADALVVAMGGRFYRAECLRCEYVGRVAPLMVAALDAKAHRAECSTGDDR